MFPYYVQRENRSHTKIINIIYSSFLGNPFLNQYIEWRENLNVYRISNWFFIQLQLSIFAKIQRKRKYQYLHFHCNEICFYHYESELIVA